MEKQDRVGENAGKGLRRVRHRATVRRGRGKGSNTTARVEDVHMSVYHHTTITLFFILEHAEAKVGRRGEGGEKAATKGRGSGGDGEAKNGDSGSEQCGDLFRDVLDSRLRERRGERRQSLVHARCLL